METEITNVKTREIVYCNLHVMHDKEFHMLENIVYKHIDGFFYKKKHLKPLRIHKKVKVIEVDIIARLGFENSNVAKLDKK